MKLKKIVSLALAGILAVSMLTACGDKGNASSTPAEEEVVVDTSIAGVLTDEVDEDLIKFSYDSNLQKNLDLAILVNGGAKDATDDQVKNSLLKILDVTDTQITDFYGYEGKGNGSKKGTQTFTVVVKDTSSKTDKELMKTVEANLQNLDSLNEKYEAANADYTYTYNSKVAMVKVEKDGIVYRFVVASIDCVTDGVLTED